MGMTTELERKSKKSSRLVPAPKGSMNERPLYPMFTTMPATTTTAITTANDFLRDQPAPSCTMDTHDSVSEMALVSAANSTNKKNKKPIAAAAPPNVGEHGRQRHEHERGAGIGRHRLARPHGHERRRPRS